MKIYIAGKISGDKTYKSKFKMAEKRVKALGYIALNPAVLPEGLSREEYMAICLPMLQMADGVLFLPDSGQSDGAQLELKWCIYTGKETWFSVDAITGGNF